jgi:hypothetical protein
MCQRYEPGLPCHDAACATCPSDPRLDPVCECGDWQSDHPEGDAPCRICHKSRTPWDQCERFRFSHWAPRHPLSRASS